MYMFNRLGGIISAYKIVPDELDEIKVNISLPFPYTHANTDTW